MTAVEARGEARIHSTRAGQNDCEAGRYACSPIPRHRFSGERSSARANTRVGRAASFIAIKAGGVVE